MNKTWNSSINRAKLDQLAAIQLDDEPNIVIELIETFLSTASRRIWNAEQSVLNSDFLGASKEAHGLKSSSQVLGAENLSAICHELESIKSNGNKEQGLSILHRLKVEYSQAELELNRIKSEIEDSSMR